MASTVNAQDQNSSSDSDDGFNPYFIHHSDNSGLVLISQPLTGDNYPSWNRAMVIALSVKNKIGFIDGTIILPEDNEDLLNQWIRNNNIVISWILNSISKEISASVIYLESAHEIWIDMKERYQQRNGPRIFQLRRELMNHIQGQSSVSTYFTKLKTIWEELNNYRQVCSYGRCNCGGSKKLAEHYQTEYVMLFLMRLNDSYAQVRGQLLLMDLTAFIKKVFSLVSQEEHQRNVSTTSNSRTISDSMAFYAKNDAKKDNTGQVYNKWQRKERSPMCTYCGGTTYSVEKCYKLHGYPPGYKTRQRLPSFIHSDVNKSPNYMVANQVSESISDQNQNNVGDFVQTLNQNQYQQLISMLNNHLASAKVDTGADSIRPNQDLHNQKMTGKGKR